MNRESCSECRFFRGKGGGEGACRRRAPDANASGCGRAFSWPVVKDVNWCGEFVRLPVEPRHKPAVSPQRRDIDNPGGAR